MIKIFTILALAIPTFVLGQGQTEHYRNFVFESNLPAEIYHFYTRHEIQNVYTLRTDLNPFYLRGDFDGDKRLDYALSIVEKKTKKNGILIYHTGTGAHYIVGAGRPLSSGNGGDDYKWMEAWKVYIEKDADHQMGGEEKIMLKGEGILAIKLESSSGIIYWSGSEYKWFQQGD